MKSTTAGAQLLLLVLTVVAGTTGEAQQMPPTSVETEPVQTAQFHNQITLVGRTEARAQSEIVAEVSGRVIRVDAPEGNPVRRGDILVTIDPRNIQYALDAKRAEVEQARVQADLKEKDLERSKNLFQQGMISDGQSDQDQAAWTQAVELYRQKQAEQKQLELDRENCEIRAPFSGYTVEKRIDVGEWVNPGTPVYELVDLSTIKVKVDLPEKYFGHLTVGSDVSVTTSGNADADIRGTVTGFAPDAQSETHTFPVIVSVENPDVRLGGGMLVRAALSLDEVVTSLSVSKDAIIRQGTQTIVYTVADGKAMPIPVQVSSTDGNRLAVQGPGLSEGMPVVVRGNERIFPGSPVRIATAEGEGTGAPPGSAPAKPGGAESKGPADGGKQP
jgi:membrane fusion protein (multidrug efflux system)